MFLGIDIGTTATKIALFDSGMNRVAAAGVVYEVDRPAPGISEIDPDVWIDAVRDALASIRLQAGTQLASTRAIGLSGQMHSIVVLGRDDRPLRPAILWNDARGDGCATDLAENVPGIAQATGVMPMASFSASKLRWMRCEQPGSVAGLHRVVWAKDYIRHWLTGEFATDMSDAAGGQLLDQASRTWFGPVLDYLELDRTQLPRLLEGCDVSGVLRRDVAADLGLPPGIPVAAGGGDAATAALGLGCTEDGQSFLSLGTGAVIACAQSAYRPWPETMVHAFAHCVPARWYNMAAMLNGASCLAFVSRICRLADVDELTALSESLGEGPGTILFQPYLRGERTPHNDVRARGAFVGLDPGCGAAELSRAALEGVAFSLRQGLETLRAAGSAVDDLTIVGGGARSEHWLRIIATVIGEPVRVVDDSHYVAAGGAARLAALSVGGSWDLATRAPAVAAEIRPSEDAAVRSAYRDRFDDYLALYPALARLARNPQTSATADPAVRSGNSDIRVAASNSLIDP